jgi:energy-coupling factor transport system permease protein
MARVLFLETAMHPVIRIVTCISFIIMIASATWPVLMIFAVSILALSLIISKEVVSKTLRLAWRLKWLMISIAVLYLWWTPGEPLSILGWHIDNQWWPTYQGLLHAVHRIGILLLIILSVQLMMMRSREDELVAAIDWLATPLRWLGITTGSFALRCALTMKALQGVEHTVRSSLETPFTGKRFTRIVNVMAAVYGKAAYDRSEQIIALDIPHIKRPALVQWIYPAVIILMPILINTLWVTR